VSESRRQPGSIGRLRSRQAGHPSGLLGRIVGRVVVKDTSAANDAALEMLRLDRPCTVVDIGFGQGRRRRLHPRTLPVAVDHEHAVGDHVGLRCHELELVDEFVMCGAAVPVEQPCRRRGQCSLANRDQHRIRRPVERRRHR
jgi:hypothetical protein